MLKWWSLRSLYYLFSLLWSDNPYTVWTEIECHDLCTWTLSIMVSRTVCMNVNISSEPVTCAAMLWHSCTSSPRKLTYEPGRHDAAPTGAAGVLDEDVEGKISGGNVDNATTFFPILADIRLEAGFHPCSYSNITPLTLLCIVVPHRSDFFFFCFGIKRKRSLMFLYLAHSSHVAF